MVSALCGLNRHGRHTWRQDNSLKLGNMLWAEQLAIMIVKISNCQTAAVFFALSIELSSRFLHVSVCVYMLPWSTVCGRCGCLLPPFQWHRLFENSLRSCQRNSFVCIEQRSVWERDKERKIRAQCLFLLRHIYICISLFFQRWWYALYLNLPFRSLILPLDTPISQTHWWYTNTHRVLETVCFSCRTFCLHVVVCCSSASDVWVFIYIVAMIHSGLFFFFVYILTFPWTLPVSICSLKRLLSCPLLSA